MKKKMLSTLCILSFLPSLSVLAQGAGSFTVDSRTTFFIVTGFTFIIAVLVLVVSIVVLQLLRTFVRQQAEKVAAERGEELVGEESAWSKMWAKLNDFRPMEEERELVLDHNYDGIRELDNHLPPWWKWLFYITIVFGVVYLAAHHVFDALPLQEEEYISQIEQAEEERKLRLASSPQEVINESNVELVTDLVELDKAKGTFATTCASCHREDGGGKNAPNLTDDYWLHGGSLSDVFRTIEKGVPEKGMAPWGNSFSPKQIQNLASYVISLKGTNPPDPRDPEGELYVPEETTATPDSTETTTVDSTSVAAL